jgi:hypothetical protein
MNYTKICVEIQNEIDAEKEKKSVEKFHTILNEQDIDLNTLLAIIVGMIAIIVGMTLIVFLIS